MKSPVVEVEAVDVAEQVHAETVALEEVSSEYETDSDDSGDWEALSHGESTIQLLRDEQLRDGLGTSLCSLTSTLPRTSPLSESTIKVGLTRTAAIQFPVPALWKRQLRIGSAFMK